jgi:hypothetical protein
MRFIAAALLLALVASSCGDTTAGPGGGGGGAQGDGGSGGGSAVSFEGSWRPASVRLTAIVPEAPYLVEADVPLPATVRHPIFDVDVELLQTIAGNTRTTWVRAVGKDVVVRIEDTIVVAGDAAVAAGEALAIEDGALVTTRTDTRQHADGKPAQLMSKMVFERHDGPVPPADWPTSVIDIP